jgi:hypothetical protein
MSRLVCDNEEISASQEYLSSVELVRSNDFMMTAGLVAWERFETKTVIA